MQMSVAVGGIAETPLTGSAPALSGRPTGHFNGQLYDLEQCGQVCERAVLLQGLLRSIIARY